MDYHAANNKQLDNKQQQLAGVVEAGRAAELRWCQVLVSDAEWGQRWRVLSSARLAAPTRSFLWKMTHSALLVDTRAARLVGDISHFNQDWMEELV